MTKRLLVGWGASMASLAIVAIVYWSLTSKHQDAAADKRIPFGVLGDSDSHSYHDSILLSAPRLRGGLFRATTYQWTEILASLRGTQVDLGPWGVWGTPGKVATFLSALGLENRAPRKEDFRFNFALSGAECEDLLNGPSRQTERLLYLMRKAPSRWAHGVVVIRIGINSIGTREDLDRYAATGLDAAARDRIGHCINYIRGSMAMIRSEHPQTAIVVVGMSDDRNLPSNFERWRTTNAMLRIGKVFDWYERSLKELCDRDPRGVFFSDRAWFATIWGHRSATGAPTYRELNLGGAVAVTNTIGDHPRNVTLSDGHAGTVSNGLWARDVVALLRSRLAFPIAPIETREVASLADPKGVFGINAHPPPRIGYLREEKRADPVLTYPFAYIFSQR